MSKTRYNLDLVFANVFFGANFSFYVSLTRNYLDFQQIFMLQVLSAAVFFIPFALFSRYSYRITWRDVGNILIVTLLIVYGWMYMLLWGSSYTTPIDASVIATLGPAFTLIMDHLMHPRKYIGTRVVGVVCALVGAGILILGDGFSLTHGSRAQGNLFVLAAVVAIAVNTVIIKPQLEKLGTLVVMGWYYIIGLAITAPFFWKYIDHVPFLRLPLFAQAELGYILILGTVLPMYLLYRGTEKLTSVHTALYRYIQPVIAGILAITRGQAHFDAAKPTLLLNSHHDTVRPTAAWTRDPFAATWEGERLYGLGANDAGASVAALTAAFRHYYDAELPFNLLLALSGEEECMGEHGTRALLPALGPIDMALVGEPTRMRAAVGERGLVVLDCTAHGRAGHAARDEGINALYIAADDIAWLRGYRFERCSPLLGPIRMTATQIEAGTQHNVVPAECRFVVDVRTTDAYTNEETVEIVRRHMRSEAVPRSTRIRASAVAPEHPLVGAAAALGVERFVSPTTSDMALMAFPSLKMGAGDSARSHTADEYVLRSEVEQGVEGYIRYIAELAKRY